MRDLIKVEGHTNFYRDPNTKAIVVDDKTKLENYLNQRRTAELASQNFVAINKEVTSLKQDVQELKNSLNTIIDLLKNKDRS